jgi:uncharacterized membrane protein YphA (DoxX/SURF4 family)
MTDFYARFRQVDRRVTHWMADHGILLLRSSLGVVYFWFGVLKFVPELSPATTLATRTIEQLTFGLVPPGVSIYILAMWETVIGLGLIAGRFLRAVLFLLAVQMIGTIMPLFLFPSEVFVRVPYAPTLEGQYIIKNLVLISAAIVIGATVRGGRLVADSQAAEAAEEIEEQEMTRNGRGGEEGR